MDYAIDVFYLTSHDFLPYDFFTSLVNQYQLTERFGHRIYTAQNGVHSSSLTVKSRVEGE